jgi:hypothetical protein
VPKSRRDKSSTTHTIDTNSDSTAANALTGQYFAISSPRPSKTTQTQCPTANLGKVFRFGWQGMNWDIPAFLGTQVVDVSKPARAITTVKTTAFGLNWLMAMMGLAAIFLWGNFVHKRLANTTSNLPFGRIFFEVDTNCRSKEFKSIRSPILTARDRLSRVAAFDVAGLSQVQQVLKAVREGFGATLQNVPVRLEISDQTQVRLALIRGGSGAVAGINGAFFVDASLSGTNNTLIGPYQTEADKQFQAERDPAILERIKSRPLVLWNAKRIAIVAFQTTTMNSRDLLDLIVPNFKDAFLGGAWIFKHGRVLTDAQLLERPAPQDVNDVRPRVFFGVTKHGEVLLGASLNPTSSSDLAGAARAAGAWEAVLLDSGYSTSLIYQTKIIAVGRHNAEVPSRPVPHAIVVMDEIKGSTITAWSNRQASN